MPVLLTHAENGWTSPLSMQSLFALPGDVLRLRAASDKTFSGLYRFNVEATVGRKLIASGSLTLALVDQLAPPTARAGRAI